MKNTENQGVIPEKKRKGFLRVPNELLDDLYSDDPVLRKKARVYLCLLRHAFFVDGVITLSRKKIPCRRGEWITTLRQLEEKTEVPKTLVSRLLAKLADEGCIRVRRLGRFTQVQLLHFDEPVVAKAAKSTDGPKSPPAASPATSPLTQRPNYKRFEE